MTRRRAKAAPEGQVGLPGVATGPKPKPKPAKQAKQPTAAKPTPTAPRGNMGRYHLAAQRLDSASDFDSCVIEWLSSDLPRCGQCGAPRRLLETTTPEDRTWLTKKTCRCVRRTFHKAPYRMHLALIHPLLPRWRTLLRFKQIARLNARVRLLKSA